MDIHALIIVSSCSINFLLLYGRKNRWVLSKYKWYAVLGLFILCVCLWLFAPLDGSVNTYLAIWGSGTPAIFSFADYVFKAWSKSIHNRDLLLWLRFSDDLSSNKRFKASDKIFSFFLLILIMVLPFLPLIFISNI